MLERRFSTVKEMGIGFLRYGPPLYGTHTGPGKYGWAFIDETFNESRQLKIIPLVDLCHFGVSDWIGDFQNPDWPRFVHEDGTTSAAGEISGYYIITQQYYNRSNFPVMHTETNISKSHSVVSLKKDGLTYTALHRTDFLLSAFPGIA